ncbi:MAG: thrombospondin type 3 repeat-containing protein [Myxococcota bacterium]|nr:thrombospondin type 3 repeat-containing protein [Myxococcota bacterium]
MRQLLGVLSLTLLIGVGCSGDGPAATDGDASDPADSVGDDDSGGATDVGADAVPDTGPDTPDDGDDDGVADEEDNCPALANADQGDADDDGLGDACDDDIDGDGLDNGDDDDIDGDGMTNEEEAEHGTDPTTVDSDGDTYSDAHELLEGTDPLDAEDRIYTGYWPYNPDKDAMGDPGWAGECPGGLMCECEADVDCESGYCHGTPKGSWCGPVVGTRFPRHIGVDQYGDMVDLYDFAGEGKVIVLDMATGWCQPCKELMRWFIDPDDLEVKENPWWSDAFLPVRDLVLSGQVRWITVLYEDTEYGPATAQLVSDWHQAFPLEDMPVVADANKDIHTWIKPSGLPCVNLLTTDFEMMMYTNRGLTDAFEMLLELYPAE